MKSVNGVIKITKSAKLDQVKFENFDLIFQMNRKYFLKNLRNL